MSVLAIPALRGLSVLLRSKRKQGKLLVITAGLLGLGLGLSLRLGGASPDQDEMVVSVALVVAALLGPLVAASWITCGPAARREELLALPVGRLALPTHVFLCGSVLTVLTALAFLLAFALATGGVAWSLFVNPSRDLALGLIGAGGLWVWAAALGSVAQHPAALALLWPIPPAILVVSAGGMGHGRDATAVWAVTWIGCVALALLLLPFLLYAGPRHTWALSRAADARGRAVLLAVVTATLALLALGLLGAGWPLLLVIVLGGAWTLRILRRARPAPRGASATPFLRSQLLLLLAWLPPLLLGLWADARAVDSIRPGGPVRLGALAIAPSGSHLAIHLVAAERNGAKRLSRVAVIDLSGRTAPVLLGERFTHIAGWSKDGRWLAVHEASYGRLYCDVPFRPSSSPWEDRFEVLLQRGGRTLCLEASTGEVRSYAPRQVRPGWLDPDELVHFSVGLAADWALSDGRGRALGLPREQDVAVREYVEGDAVLQVESRRVRWGASGIAAWTPRALPAPDCEWEGRSHQDMEGQRLVLSRGEEELVLRETFLHELRASWALVQERERLARIELPSMASRELLPGHWVHVVRLSGVGRHLFASGERWVEVDAERCAVRERPFPVGLELLGVSGDRLILRGERDTSLWLQEPDGTLRVLMR